MQDAFDATLDRVRPSASERLEHRLDDVSALVRYRSSLRNPRMLGRAVSDTISGREPRKGIPQVATVEGNRVVPRDAAFWRSALRPSGGTAQFHERRLDRERDPDLERRLADAVAKADFRPDRLDQLIRAVHGSTDRTVVTVVIPPVAAEVLASVARGSGPLPGRGRPDRGGRPSRYASPGRGLLRVSTSRLELFADVAHLNGPGSTRFSRDMAAALETG